MSVGVISHLPNPGFEDVRALARAAEAAGADWLGLPDAFWWRDTWLLLSEAARVTERIELGPLVTNPYLRHPFHTAAALASLQDLASRSRLQAGAGTLACDGSAPRPTAGSVSVDLGSVPAGAGIAGAGSARAEQGATPDPSNVRADAGSVPAGADVGHEGKVRAEEGAIPADPGSARGERGNLRPDASDVRVFVGIGAGGSEVSGAAGISRRDAPQRVRELVDLLRRVSRGEPLDERSGRTLELPLQPLPVLIAGRGDALLRVAGECADRALLWAIPRSDLARSVSLVMRGANNADLEPGSSLRPAPLVRLPPRGTPELVWAPLVDHGGPSRERLRTIAAYSVLNSHPSLHVRWGLNAAQVTELRGRLVAGGAAAAESLVPPEALDDLIYADASPAAIGAEAAAIGATSLAVPAFSIDEVSERVAWARAVLQHPQDE